MVCLMFSLIEVEYNRFRLLVGTQGAKTHVRRVIVIRKREGMMRMEPAVVGKAAFVGSTNFQFADCRSHAPTLASYDNSIQY